MLLKVFSVYDSQVEAYMQPFFCQSKGHAIRSFTEAVSDSSSTIGKYPSDFTLFELGEFDDQKAFFDLYDTPRSLGVAVEFVKTVV